MRGLPCSFIGLRPLGKIEGADRVETKMSDRLNRGIFLLIN